jgi:hypothetical protein
MNLMNPTDPFLELELERGGAGSKTAASREESGSWLEHARAAAEEILGHQPLPDCQEQYEPDTRSVRVISYWKAPDGGVLRAEFLDGPRGDSTTYIERDKVWRENGDIYHASGPVLAAGSLTVIEEAPGGRICRFGDLKTWDGFNDAYRQARAPHPWKSG